MWLHMSLSQSSLHIAHRQECLNTCESQVVWSHLFGFMFPMSYSVCSKIFRQKALYSTESILGLRLKVSVQGVP